MYSKETLDTIEGATFIGNTLIWVNTGLDWHENPGILLGDQGCWNRLSREDAEELIVALQEKLKVLGHQDNLVKSSV